MNPLIIGILIGFALAIVAIVVAICALEWVVDRNIHGSDKK